MRYHGRPRTSYSSARTGEEVVDSTRVKLVEMRATSYNLCQYITGRGPGRGRTVAMRLPQSSALYLPFPALCCRGRQKNRTKVVEKADAAVASEKERRTGPRERSASSGGGVGWEGSMMTCHLLRYSQNYIEKKKCHDDDALVMVNVDVPATTEKSEKETKTSHAREKKSWASWSYKTRDHDIFRFRFERTQQQPRDFMLYHHPSPGQPISWLAGGRVKRVNE